MGIILNQNSWEIYLDCCFSSSFVTLWLVLKFPFPIWVDKCSRTWFWKFPLDMISFKIAWNTVKIKIKPFWRQKNRLWILLQSCTGFRGRFSSRDRICRIRPFQEDGFRSLYFAQNLFFLYIWIFPKLRNLSKNGPWSSFSKTFIKYSASSTRSCSSWSINRRDSSLLFFSSNLKSRSQMTDRSFSSWTKYLIANSSRPLSR